jgi:RNase P/RNase MRP subunit p29
MENGTFHDEIIGTNAKIIDSKNRSAMSLEGMVIDETKHMLTIERKNGTRKRLIKSQHTFQFDDKVVPGAALEGRPDERIKKWTRGK